MGIQEVLPAKEEVRRPFQASDEPSVSLFALWKPQQDPPRYFEVIDEGSGRSPRMAFYQVAGNEDNLRRWEHKLCDEWRLVSRIKEEDWVYYRKTELGESLHRILRNHDYVGSLLEELVRERLRLQNW